jgi:YLP motif-containing protein 1
MLLCCLITDALDGVRKSLKRKHETSDSVSDSLEEVLLSLKDKHADESSSPSKPKKKRVRWSDVENQKLQQRRREIGFVIGQDWSSLTPDSKAVKKLLTGNDP